MERKNIIVIVVVSILSVGTLVALIPVFMYGLRVDVLSVGTGFGLMTPLSSSSSDSYNTMQFSGFTTPSVNVQHVEVGPYEYLFDGGEAKSVGTTALQLLSQYVDLTIYINITTPNDQLYELTFTLEDLVNIITQNVNILLGPDEIEIVNGTYTVSVAVELTISIPDLVYEETFYYGPQDFYIDVIIE
ncbi:MAG: hypothetical protein ACFFAK_15220 [Promethearchaeota archaeon]